MAEWGRKQYSKPWPSRAHVWTWGAFFLSCLFFFGVFCLDYWRGWTAAERLYLFDYLKSGVRQKLPAAKTRYTLLEGKRLVFPSVQGCIRVVTIDSWDRRSRGYGGRWRRSVGSWS
jgi:hypothetical protein